MGSRHANSKGGRVLTTDNWGCPDWQDADAYPSELKDWEWRWEFLRRDPKYRDFWKNRSEISSVSDRNITYSIAAWVHHAFNLETIIDPTLPISAFPSSPFVYCAGMPFALPPKEYFDEWFEENGVNLGDDSAKLSFLVDFFELAGLPASHAHWPWWLTPACSENSAASPTELKNRLSDLQSGKVCSVNNLAPLL